jgi:hypothetical protein
LSDFGKAEPYFLSSCNCYGSELNWVVDMTVSVRYDIEAFSQRSLSIRMFGFVQLCAQATRVINSKEISDNKVEIVLLDINGIIH